MGALVCERRQTAASYPYVHTSALMPIARLSASAPLLECVTLVGVQVGAITLRASADRARFAGVAWSTSIHVDLGAVCISRRTALGCQGYERCPIACTGSWRMFGGRAFHMHPTLRLLVCERHTTHTERASQAYTAHRRESRRGTL